MRRKTILLTGIAVLFLCHAAACGKKAPSGDGAAVPADGAALAPSADGAALAQAADGARNEGDADIRKNAEDNLFRLIDPASQLPILQYRYPKGWITGGNAQWVQNNPAMPHSWYTWAASPDGLMRFMFSSPVEMAGQGRIAQNPMLNDPNGFAQNFFIQAAQKDYGVRNVRIASAQFLPDPNASQKQQQILQETAQYGFRVTDIRCVIYSLELRGTRDNREFFVSYMAPMNVIEMQPGMGFTHTVEFPQLFSFGGPVSDQDRISDTMQNSVETIEMNPNFAQFRSQVAQMQTQQAIAEINRRYEMIHQQHLRNMADSDARLKGFLEESDRKHAQRMGGSGSSGSGSMLDKWDEYIKDVDLVKNPNDGNDIFIDNRRDHAWINSDNEIMYMDSGLFNPNENAAFNNREWRRVR